MCGIAGIVNLAPQGLDAPERDALARMAASIQHRGPDAYGLYRDQHAGLAHARLAIVDIAHGQQPMSTEHSQTWVVFNGEIFNHVELRETLARMGYLFRTHSDTEVILQAYRAWGIEGFKRFNGQWAFALWDASAQRLVLARDPMGVCPLHVCEHAGRLYFASEVKAIFAATPSIPRAFDAMGLAQTIHFWSIAPPQGVYQGIAELLPGTAHTYDLCGHRSEQLLYAPGFPERPALATRYKGSLDDAVAEVRAALDKATAMRMLRSDVPVGSYLSGGLDSSLVAALGQRYASGRFQTFSLRFADAEYDETAFQQLMVARLGSEHYALEVTRDDIAQAFPEVVHHTERPLLRTAPAPLFLLSRAVRQQGIKVVLTGEGADEMFAGYDIFREGKVRRFWGRQPDSTWRHRLLERLYPYLARSPVSQQAMARQFFGRGREQHADPGFAHATRWHTSGALMRLLSGDVRSAIGTRNVVREFLDRLPPAFHQWEPLAQDQYIETHTLLTGYLMSSQGDRMLLGHGVEGRFPFLDPDVIALADSLPADYKLKVLDEKHVVKRACTDLVPPEILQRKKQPYRAPDALCFVGPNAPDYVADAFSEGALREAGVFDVRAVRQLFAKCQQRAHAEQLSNTDNMALVAVLSTQLLHRQFLAPAALSNATGTPALQWATDIEPATPSSH